jgi:hypothetical protein
MHVLRWQMLINQQQAYRYQVSHEWVERDLIELDHIPTALNQADHFKNRYLESSSTVTILWVMFRHHTLLYTTNYVAPAIL